MGQATLMSKPRLSGKQAHSCTGCWASDSHVFGVECGLPDHRNGVAAVKHKTKMQRRNLNPDFNPTEGKAPLTFDISGVDQIMVEVWDWCVGLQRHFDFEAIDGRSLPCSR